jgi:hypothetical protein
MRILTIFTREIPRIWLRLSSIVTPVITGISSKGQFDMTHLGVSKTGVPPIPMDRYHSYHYPHWNFAICGIFVGFLLHFQTHPDIRLLMIFHPLYPHYSPWLLVYTKVFTTKPTIYRDPWSHQSVKGLRARNGGAGYIRKVWERRNPKPGNLVP